jgi:hypothetical protein
VAFGGYIQILALRGGSPRISRSIVERLSTPVNAPSVNDSVLLNLVQRTIR